MKNDSIGGGSAPAGGAGNVLVLERPGNSNRADARPGDSAGREGGAIDDGVRAVFTAHTGDCLPAEIDALAHALAGALASRRAT